MDWQPVLDFLATLGPTVSYVFIALGAIVSIGTVVDKMIPDEKDKGFMKALLAKPIIGDVLKAVARFSPFNVKDEYKE